MRRPLLLAFWAVSFLSAAQAAAVWTNIGPPGGEARSLSSDGHGSNVYVLNPRSGIFQSTNGGPWKLVFDTMQRGLTPTRVVVDPVTSRVFVGTTTGLYRSDNDGATWRLLLGSSIIDISALNGQALASARDGMIRSLDSGDTWNAITTPVSMRNEVLIIRIDPGSPERFWAVESGNLYQSADGGTTWHRMDPTGVTSLSFEGLLYAGGRDGVWGCDADCFPVSAVGVNAIGAWGGKIYSTIGDNVVTLSVMRTDVVGAIRHGDPVLSFEAAQSVLLAGTYGGVFASNDGAHWVGRSDGFAQVRINAMAMASGKLVTATTRQGVLRRDGVAWNLADAELPSTVPFLVSDGASTLYAAIPNTGVFRSGNQGMSWESVGNGLASTDILGLAADRDTVIFTTFRDVVTSFDRGMTWQPLASYPAFSAATVAVRGSIIAVADVASAVISTDNGATWKQSDVPSAIRSFAILDGHVYAGTDAGLFAQQNNGWLPVVPGKINAIDVSGSRLLVASSSGVFFSSDGANFQLVSGSETLPADVTSIAGDDALVYVGTNGASIFASELAAQPQRRRAVTH